MPHQAPPQKSKKQTSGPAQSKKALQKTKGGKKGAQVVPWWESWYLLGGVSLVVVVVLGVFIFETFQPVPSFPVESVPASVLSAITHPDVATLEAVEGGGNTLPLTPVAKSLGAGKLTSGGKMEFFYEGAEYCPFCAAERWSMIIALSRFGTFSNLHLMESSSTDIYPDTHTFDFVGSDYTSKYVAFVHVETLDRNKNTLQTPTNAENSLLAVLTPGLPSNEQDSIPFLTIGNKYMEGSSGYSPQVLQGLSWQKIADDLSNPSSAVTKAIDGNANYLTAAICEADGSAPASVCKTPLMTTMEAKLS